MNYPRSLTLLFCISLSLCRGSDVAANLRRDVDACAAACNRRDFNAFVSYLPGRLYPDRNARIAAIAEIKNDLESGNDPSLHVSIGALRRPRRYRNLYATIVPIVAVLEWPFARITDDSFLLAVSENGGQTWRFLPLYEVPQQDVDRFYPEFERKVLIPEPIPPTTQVLIPN